MALSLKVDIDTMNIKLVLLLLLLPFGSYAGEQLIIGIHPYKSPSILIEKYQPLAKYLSKKLSLSVDIKISKNYESHIKSIANNEFDIAYMGPASYVKLADKFGMKPILVRQTINGKAVFKGTIIVREDSSIQRLSDMKGKHFAFGDAASTMSHLVPRYMLIKSGVSIEKLKHKFYGSHDNVALAVLTGDADAGAVKEAVYYKYKNRGLRALKFTPEISEHLFVATPKLKRTVMNEIKNILLDMKPNNEVHKVIFNSIKPGVDGFTNAKDSDYDNLRLILKTVNP